jgi:hypothetical protein
MKALCVISAVAFVVCAFAAAQPNVDSRKGPDLSGSWPTTMTLSVLQDEGLIPSGQIITTATWTDRLVSERLGKHMWHQLYLVRYKLPSGEEVSAIADIDYSPMPDMNMGPVVYVVSKILQPEGKPEPRQH